MGGRCPGPAPTLLSQGVQPDRLRAKPGQQAPRTVEQEQEALLRAKYGALQPKKKLLPKARSPPHRAAVLLPWGLGAAARLRRAVLTLADSVNN